MHTRALMAIAAGLALAACSHQNAEAANAGSGRNAPTARARRHEHTVAQANAAQARRGAKPRSTREIFASGDNYKLDGSVAAVRHGTITVRRKGLPPADLQVARETKIELGGRPAHLGQIRPGDEVRATFNVAGDRLIAVAVDAKPSKRASAEASSRKPERTASTTSERRQARTGR